MDATYRSQFPSYTLEELEAALATFEDPTLGALEPKPGHIAALKTEITGRKAAVAELRARIAEGKGVALRRLGEHAADETQPAASREVCRILAARVAASLNR